MPEANSTNATPVNDAHGSRCGGCSGHAGHFIKDGRLWLWCAKCKRRWRWHSDTCTALFAFAPTAEHFDNVIAEWPDVTPQGWGDRVGPEWRPGPPRVRSTIVFADGRAVEFYGFQSPDSNAARSSPGQSSIIRLRCIAALGDILYACSIAAALKKQQPDSLIALETAYPELADGNPYIDAAVQLGADFAPGERLIDLSLDLDWKPQKHRLVHLAEMAGVPVHDAEFFMRSDLWPGLPDKYIAIHVGPTGVADWKGRNWLPDRWHALAEELSRDGAAIVAVGSDPSVSLPAAVIDLRAKTTVHQTAGIIERAHTFVGIESFPAIVAQGFGVPCVLFFGSILPPLRVFRDNTSAVRAARLSCLGCHHNEPKPVVTTVCHVGGEPCQSEVSVEQFAAAVREAMKCHDGRRSNALVIPEAESDPILERKAGKDESPMIQPGHKPDANDVSFAFIHGLGDLANFAHQIPLYTRRGRRIRVHAEPQFAPILLAAGAEVIDEPPSRKHEWLHATIPESDSAWLHGNKCWNNVSAWPMPNIGRDPALWDEYRNVQIDLEPFLKDEEREAVEKFLAPLRRPIVVIHPQGRPPHDTRSISVETARAVYRGILNQMPGTIICVDLESCDFYNPAVKSRPGATIDHPRFVSIARDFGETTLLQLYWLIKRSELFIGIDSGPGHFSRFAYDTPGIICWVKPQPCFGCPSLLSLPRHNTTHIVTRADCKWTQNLPSQYNPQISPGFDEIDPHFVVEEAIKTLKPKTVSKVVIPKNQAAEREFTIHVIREGTPGDVLAASGVVSALRKRHPAARILFSTACPDVLRDHPHINEVLPMSQEIKPAPRMTCDLAFASDRAPYTNMMEAYAAVARVKPEECEFHFKTECVAGLPEHYAAMHIGPVGSEQFHWVGRDWFTDRFAAVSKNLAERGIATVIIGDSRVSNQGELWPLGTLDLRGKTNMHQLGYVVKQSRLFIGLDSFPMHVAQALNVPGVAFFGCVLPSHRIYRENMIGVNASHLPCIGCHHESTLYRELGICETSVCKVGDERCREAVSVDSFMAAINEQLERTAA